MNNSIQQRLNHLKETINSQDFLANRGLGNEVGYYIFDYNPKDELFVREYIRNLLKNNSPQLEGYTIQVFNLYELMVNYIEEKGYGKYFTHRTGHSIGMEDHKYGDVSSVNEDIIQVGQVFSIEPGIYLMDEEIGVRIEDLVIITEDGCEVLNHFTKDLIVVPMED